METQGLFLPGSLQTTGARFSFLALNHGTAQVLKPKHQLCWHTVLTVLLSECHFTIPINPRVITQGDLSFEKQNGWT